MSAIDLVVLGMIKDRPQSAYELQKQVEYRHISKWVKVSTPAIYKKVVQLEEKGYIAGEITRAGKMPEKTVYRLTELGENRFLNLMEETAGESLKVLFDFNAVIMNLGLVSKEKRGELLGYVESGICDFEREVADKQPERRHIPLTGRTILEQQVLVARALTAWITGFKQEYSQEE